MPGLCRAALLVSAGILHAAGAPGLAGATYVSPSVGVRWMDTTVSPHALSSGRAPRQQHRVRIMVQEGEDRGWSLVSRTPLSRTSKWQ